jgi:hypothetical protein
MFHSWSFFNDVFGVPVQSPGGGFVNGLTKKWEEISYF